MFFAFTEKTPIRTFSPILLFYGIRTKAFITFVA
ncbi:hypothetical protein Halhy_3206 [Haliscomenobacter hydrossis DSM 1100]|uniref:Uncharacterized protein n=1 Tax=Haliscomenobacter hydrossis (strain ATCC 27775 / DSM 1100 / LMG 10767 / O) TaxID=760192 RepID=F4KRX9_HALH1|nr:hypothetical protein Halhy_3206 [Haliscomenobacter hydrossis DSM 1100]